ncbi:MAG TPA: PPC domain-containing protein, partial [Pyrinomonadaceae bacterium]|nr:PPC domain-containing protein [Pyrinomonadaceae bacterium]
CSHEKPPGNGKAAFAVTASLLGVVMQDTDSRGDLSSDFSQPVTISYSNSHGSFVGEIAGTGLASVYTANLSLDSDGMREFELDVVPGSTRVGASVDAQDGGSSDVDLYLFDCSTGECILRDFSAGSGSSERVAIDSPAPGKWKVIVDRFNAGDRRNSFQYKDYVTHPAFGRIEVQNDAQPIAHGAVVTQPINLKIGAVPVGPRSLEAMLLVVSRTGPNTDTQKKTDTYDLYYPDHAILGAANISLKIAALQSTRK